MNRTITKMEFDAIERTAESQAQKEAVALDRGFEPKVVPNKKRKPSRKRKVEPGEE